MYLFLIAFILISLSSAQLIRRDSLDVPPCNVPPFISETIVPNVMMIIDNSGSMNYEPYTGTYDEASLYYGYFDPDSFYEYNTSTNIWEPTQSWSGVADLSDLNHMKMDGNLLNYMYMRRLDNLRKVLTGGRIYDKEYAADERIIFDGSGGRGDSYYRYFYADDNCFYRTIMGYSSSDGSYHRLYYLYKREDCTSGDWDYKATPKAYLRVRGNVTESEFQGGIIHKIFDKVKLGMAHFHDNEGGYIEYPCGTVTEETYIDHINNMYCDTWTPLAETYYEVTRYFRATSGYFNVTDYSSIDPIDGWCQKNFVILITDGESTMDLEIPDEWLKDYDNDGNDPGSFASSGSDYLDDVALWSHTTDLRSDFVNEQEMSLYTIYVFGTESMAIDLLSDAAKNGAFDDKNGNDIPDLPEEYDFDSDSVPDGFFNAENGYLLEDALTTVFVNLLRRSVSASAVSVVSSTSKGEGLVFQAFFQPAKFVGSAHLSWIGDLHSLWIDPYGNMREDTDSDGKLDMEDDYISRIYFDPVANKTRVDLWEDTDGDGDGDLLIDKADLDIVKSVWRAGEKLKNDPASNRRIFYVSNSRAFYMDSALYAGAPGTTDSSEVVNLEGSTWKFKTSYVNNVKRYLAVTSTSVAESLIDYIRGVDYEYTRTRTIGSDVWKLGDIINSSPKYVGAPAERYDLIYSDTSYRPFYIKYKNRKPIVFVGANDGTLHAFHCGRYVELPGQQERGYLVASGYNLGEEMWALIPHNLLPHLKWLTDPDYCHVPYVDLTVKIFDARVFADDDIHPNGWGTILVGGLRFGGSEYTAQFDTVSANDTLTLGKTYTPSYYVIDITDPDYPGFMFEFSSDDLTYTTSRPGIMLSQGKWFLLMGSGPVDMIGLSDQKGKLYALDISNINYKVTSELKYVIDPVTASNHGVFILPDDNSHFGDFTPIDANIDGTVEVVYFSVSYLESGNWKGKIYRLNTNNSASPGDWLLSNLINIPAPITTSPVATIDANGNLWVYAGSGRYFSDQDEQDISSQYIVGVKDPYWQTGGSEVSWDSLFDVSNASVQITDTGTYVYGLGEEMSYSELRVKISAKSGWKRTLQNTRERIISNPILIGGALFFTSFVPSEDICAFGGTSRLYGVDYLTGIPGETSILGQDSDGWLYHSVLLGEGVPSSPAAHIGITDQATILVQLSTGTISQTAASIKSPKSGSLFWRGK